VSYIVLLPIKPDTSRGLGFQCLSHRFRVLKTAHRSSIQSPAILDI